MSGILLAAWLTLGWLPQGGVVAYDPPQFIDAGESYLVELGAEASWGPAFAGGSMRVPMWQEQGQLSFWPSQLISTTDIGLEWDPIRVGWKHCCSHPVTPYLPMIEWYQGQLVPYFDSAYDLLYLTLSVGKRAKK